MILSNNSSSKQNKKNPKYPFVDIDKQETCTKFQQKLLKSTVVGARQSFQFFRQNIWFLENSTALPNFLFGILHYLISITKLQKGNQSIKPIFY